MNLSSVSFFLLLLLLHSFLAMSCVGEWFRLCSVLFSSILSRTYESPNFIPFSYFIQKDPILIFLPTNIFWLFRCYWAVVGETVSLQVTPRTEVTMDSSNRTSICERLHINGLQRLKHIDRYAHSLKLILSSNISNTLRTSIDVCFHR